MVKTKDKKHGVNKHEIIQNESIIGYKKWFFVIGNRVSCENKGRKDLN